MLTDYLAGRISFDALCTLIPARNHAVRIEHIDRVVRHAFDQQAEQLFTAPQGFFRLATLGEIAGNFREAHQLARGQTHRIDHHMGPEASAILADAPAFAFEFSLPFRSLQSVLRQTGGAILRRVETGEMLPDYFG